MEFLFATNNAHKLEELRRLFKGSEHTIIGLKEAGVASVPEETGRTFLDNARLKAKAACRLSSMPSIADDSGLCVDAMEGAPGVESARFAGVHGDDTANNEKLLRLLRRIPFAKRTAHFTCALVLQMPNGHRLEVEGRCDGIIGFSPSGENGFGYDPLFFVNGKSLADYSAEEKDALSHRGKALQALTEQLPAFLKKADSASSPPIEDTAPQQPQANQNTEETS